MAAIFIDRDGVINSNRPDHVKSWDEFEFLPGVLEALARLTERGHSIFVVTNQAIIGRGIVSRDTVEAIHQRMVSEVHRHGGRIDSVMVCPHDPLDGCSCRKPMPGLLAQVLRNRNADLRGAYLVGDFTTDVEAAEAVSCTPILVKTGRGARALRTMSPYLKKRCLIARNLADAVEIIERLERPKLKIGHHPYQAVESGG